MPRYQTLNSTQQKGHGWRPFNSLAHAAGDICAPVLLAELKMLLPHYVLAFVGDGADGYRLVCVQGLHTGENLLLSAEGKWLLPYVPSMYRGYPFALLPVSTEENARSALCIDVDSGLYLDNPDPARGEQLFFSADGELSEVTQATLKFLGQRQLNQQATQRAVNALAAAGVLQPCQWQLDNSDPARPLARGWFTVDESKLAAVRGEPLQELHTTGALLLAAAQLLSAPRLQLLQTLAQRRRELASLAAVDSIEELWGEKDDTLQFHF